MRHGARERARSFPRARADDSADLRTAATNFAVVRVKRDVLRRGYVGVLGTHRSPAGRSPGDNAAYGLDTNLWFFQNVNIIGYYAQTRIESAADTGRSYLGRLDYNADLLGLQVERLAAGGHFNPEVGFMRRTEFVQSRGQLRVSRRPPAHSAIRKISFESALDYITDNDERLENRDATVAVRTDMQSGDSWNIQCVRNFEWVDEAFDIVGTRVPGGAYHFSSIIRGGYTLGTQRKISGEITAARGGFYDGHRTDLSYRGRAELSPRLSVEPAVSVNWVDLPSGRFTATVLSGRGTLSFSPRTLVAALVQFNSAANLVTTNIRYRWEYRSGSELFVVYSDGRDTRFGRADDVSALLNRGVTIKLTRLFRL